MGRRNKDETCLSTEPSCARVDQVFGSHIPEVKQVAQHNDGLVWSLMNSIQVIECEEHGIELAEPCAENTTRHVQETKPRHLRPVFILAHPHTRVNKARPSNTPTSCSSNMMNRPAQAA